MRANARVCFLLSGWKFDQRDTGESKRKREKKRNRMVWYACMEEILFVKNVKKQQFFGKIMFH